MLKVLVVPRAIWPLNSVRPDASDTKSQLLPRAAKITSSTPVPVETVASSVGVASLAEVEGVGLADSEAVAIGSGISRDDVFEIII